MHGISPCFAFPLQGQVKKRIRILYLIPSLSIGGAEVQLLEMVKGSIEAGGSGVSIGRNAFQHSHPSLIFKAIAQVVHKNATVEEALEIVEKK